jgi:hypothetical protein
MSSAKVAAAALVVAMSLSACGVKAKPVAGSQAADAYSQQHFFSALTKHEQCLTQKHVKWHAKAVHARGAPPAGWPAIQVRSQPSGPTIVFRATPGAAQYAQMQGQAQAAEAIGSALLYPNQASDALLNAVEKCVAKDVTG